MGLTKALYLIALGIFTIAIVQYLQYKLDYDYLYDNIPTCESEEKEIEV